MARFIKNVPVTRRVSEGEKRECPYKRRPSLTRRVSTLIHRWDIFNEAGHRFGRKNLKESEVG